MTDESVIDREEQRFAFGRNTIDGCSCPAVAAGFDPEYGTSIDHMAGEYDRKVWARLDDLGNKFDGVVSEEIAREAWLDALEDVDAQVVHSAGIKVAEKLDWL